MSAEKDNTSTVTDEPNVFDAKSNEHSPGREDFGKLLYGCNHYRRRCKIRAPCCNRVFTCRHCHNETMNSDECHDNRKERHENPEERQENPEEHQENPEERNDNPDSEEEERHDNPEEHHEIVRHDVKQVICAVCNTEQEVAPLCSNCGVKFGEYFCGICKFFDDDNTKEQFHCYDCGICRVGGRENFFHCPKCGSCYSVDLHNNHLCVENSMKNHCPICYEFLFDSVKGTTIMKCGHTIHKECFSEMILQNQYRCPICSKSLKNMSSDWKRLDEEIEATSMPEVYCYKVSILCNDCNNTSEADFHIFGLKCGHCGSYNTRRIPS